MPPIYLIARRDYLAYVGAWGFWVSLITAPLLLAVIAFAPALLVRAEPPRELAVLAERAEDAAIVQAAFEDEARRAARTEVQAYLEAAAPALVADGLAAFDAAPDRPAAIAAARAVAAERAPAALRAFPNPSPRYRVRAPPAPDIEGVKPYLTGAAQPALYGALMVRRMAGQPTIEYWSVNLSHDEPSLIARRALARAMRHEALAGIGAAPGFGDALDRLSPSVTQFDPRPAAIGAEEVTLRQRAPFYTALFLAFVLWSAVFGVANMLLSGVIEEKSNKILDTLLTSASPGEILIGKLLGAAAVSVTLFAVWGLLGGAVASAAASRAADGVVGQIAAAFLEPHLLAAFGIGFVAGYLMYGAIFVAIGALCESIQDAQSLLGPVALVLTVPMLLIAPAIDNPNAPVIEAASWFPLFTPFLLLVRAPTGLGWLEIAGLGLAMGLTLVLVLRLAARVFRAGLVDQANIATLRRRLTPAGWRKPD